MKKIEYASSVTDQKTKAKIISNITNNISKGALIPIKKIKVLNVNDRVKMEIITVENKVDNMLNEL